MSGSGFGIPGHKDKVWGLEETGIPGKDFLRGALGNCVDVDPFKKNTRIIEDRRLVMNRFNELNQYFMKTCIESLQSKGRDSCLAPIAADYILHSLKLLSGIEPDNPNETHSSSFLALGARIRKLADDYSSILPATSSPNEEKEEGDGHEKMEKEAQAHGFKLGLESEALYTTKCKVHQIKTNQNECELKGVENHVVQKLETGNRFLVHTDNNLGAFSSPPNAENQEEDEHEKMEKEAQAHEFKPVLESEALYTTRCKVHQIKKNKNEYELKGVGNLFVQKLETGHRLLVRADNNLGNIILNMKISPDIPLNLSANKKQVLFIDPSDSTPITIVVKDGQALFNVLKECQGI